MPPSSFIPSTTVGSALLEVLSFFVDSFLSSFVSVIVSFCVSFLLELFTNIIVVATPTINTATIIIINIMETPFFIFFTAFHIFPPSFIPNILFYLIIKTHF